MRKLIIILVLLVAAGGGYFLFANRPTPVEVATVTRGDIAHIVYASGVVEAAVSADVTSIVAQRITGHCNCEGQSVEAGDLIVELDDSETVARVRELEARIGLFNQQVERATNLLDRGVGSREAFDRAASELASAEAGLAAQREVLSRYRITAPIDGQILRLDADVGEVAQAGDVLFTVGQPRPLEITAEINEEDIPLIEVGQRALLRADAFPDQVLEATLASITPKGDSVLKTYRVRLALPEDTPLFIGMSVDVNLVIENREDRLLAPTTAFSGGNTVFVVDGGTAREIPVETGLRGITTVEVTGGLEEGTALVSPVPDGLVNGARIRATGS
ncbi:MAG: efflux RND transporter periplasmic adaptor subunit [Rhizobiales bacterium]|nr:efflux RND transporter periplasmic adaptor subunit [Hyphomicrobiales bacterium]MBO6700498.1 efflux RND transporter periplasmic adaptor subunit [Hyphomicrobiales bacterium]MBO6738034.1 efflux RND transporter periplasmic adaptor subunit [Hyphomicrobiales bacterium]MBO6913659.1 efflux RND transporter periplasmic adaptor subunit [Hyphomicrobiales bacterium]MBO6954444.1 efflux RND transporter periplasmic adaptor subunit [Hyphomicrobiales bacterium]